MFRSSRIWIMSVLCCFYAQSGASSTRISSWLMQPLVLCVFVMTVARGQVRYSVPEEMTKGSLVGNIVQDLGLDVKRLKSGRARIFTEDSREYIGLNVDKGTLLVKERIDREELCYNLILTAFDGGSPQKTGTLKINIIVLDANDNAPVFSQSVYTALVAENASMGSLVLKVSATDADQGTNKQSDLKYGRPCSESIISLDSSGTQTLTHAQRGKLNDDSFDQVSSSE
uniref:Cadherin domain-containing protein n=1 Tax=Sinocyclocheilus grahami TaxID=75366 RepID=A0A672SMZ0_SINGR